MFQALIDFMSYPFKVWSEGSHGFAVVCGLVESIVVILVVWVIWMILSAIWRKVSWLVNRRHCQHCGEWTTGSNQQPYPKFGSNLPECLVGQPCCWRHTVHHKAEAEPKYLCPVCGGQMVKVEDDGLVYDRCNSCLHYLVSGDELAALRQRSYNSGESDGESSGLLFGLAIGTAIN